MKRTNVFCLLAILFHANGVAANANTFDAKSIYQLAKYQNEHKDYADGQLSSGLGIALEATSNSPFDTSWNGLLFEYSNAAFKNGCYIEAFLATKLLLENDTLSSVMKEQLEKNLTLAQKKALLSFQRNQDNPKQNGVANDEEDQKARNAFFLAKSFHREKNYDKAIEQYEKRARSGGDERERYWSYLQIGLINETLKKDPQEIIKSYRQAYECCGSSAEALYKLSNFLRKQGQYENAYQAASQLVLQNPVDSALKEEWIYDYGNYLEFSLAAFHQKKYLLSYLASEILLSNRSIPDTLRKAVEQNLSQIKENLTAELESNRFAITPQTSLSSPDFSQAVIQSIPLDIAQARIEEPILPVTPTIEKVIQPTPIVKEEPVNKFSTTYYYPSVHETVETIEIPAPTLSLPSVEPCCCDQIHRSSSVERLYTIGHFGDGFGNVGSYQTVGAYFDWDWDDDSSIQPFLDLRGQYFGKDRWGGNFGFGARFVDDCSNNVYGLNVFYDLRPSHKLFQQVGFGLELGTEKFDFWLNYYLPVGCKNYEHHVNTFTYPGGYFASIYEQFNAFRGGDIQVGTSLNRWICPNPIDVYVAVGAYRYNSRPTSENSFTGVNYRCELNYNDFFFVGVNGTYDDYFHSTVQGYVGLEVPLDDCGFAFCDRIFRSCGYSGILGKPVQRNPVILKSNPRCVWDTNF